MELWFQVSDPEQLRAQGARKKINIFHGENGIVQWHLRAYLAQILFIEVSCECLQSFLSLILFFLFSVTTPNLSSGKPKTAVTYLKSPLSEVPSCVELLVLTNIGI